MTEQLANSVYNPTAQLSAGIAAGDLSLTVSDVSEFIDTNGDPLVGEFRVLLWDGSTDASKEVVKVGAFDSGTGICSSLTRAVEGKNPAMDHAAGDLVELVITAGGLEQYVSDQSGGPIGVMLQNNVDNVPIPDAGDFIKLSFPTIYDNTVAGNELEALPDGIGFTLAEDGTITTTEHGFWWMEVAVRILADATAAGFFGILNADLSDGIFAPGFAEAHAGSLCYGAMVELPAGTATGFYVQSTISPTAPETTGRVTNWSASVIRIA